VNPTYDPLTQYCPIRRDLEQRGFDLVSQLAVLTEKLLRLVGHRHVAFVAMKSESANTRADIMHPQRKLAQHRLAHGC